MLHGACLNAEDVGRGQPKPPAPDAHADKTLLRKLPHVPPPSNWCKPR